MQIFFLRHGLAAEKGDYARDADRPLTEEGIKEMRKIAKGIATLKTKFDLILTSPFVRAFETAEITAGILNLESKLKKEEELQVGGDPLKLIRGINRHPQQLESILLVGHEPYLSRLISLLISGTPDVFLAMKKGGLCKLEASSLKFGQCAELRWLLTPKQLIRLGS